MFDFDYLWNEYISKISFHLNNISNKQINQLLKYILLTVEREGKIFVIGNGGSASNSNHIANDLTYPVSKRLDKGIDISSLISNESVTSCIANDEGFENIFSHQISVKGRSRDLLIVLSGSGNSENLVRAVKKSNEIGMTSFGIIGCKSSRLEEILTNGIFLDNALMQNAEDIQTIIMHFVMLVLRKNFK